VVAGGSTNALKVYNDGQTYTLWVEGSALALGGVWQDSDSKYKKNVSTLPDVLSKVLQLRGVNFEWNSDAVESKGLGTGNNIGVIAQEVEKIFPELVKEDEEGNKAVNYSNFTPVLIEAIKEQQKQIEELRKEIEALKKEKQ
jgi:antirestriction protein